MELKKRDILAMKRLATYGYDAQIRSQELLLQVKDKLIDAQIADQIKVECFYRITSLMSPQMRSPLWEKYFMRKYGFESVRANEDRGDMKKGKIYYEYKASGFNVNNALHLVQIRPWQKCDYIVQSISGDGALTFSLTKKEMQCEMKYHGATSAHGTKSANINNKNIEYRMTINQEILAAEWMKKYFVCDPLQIK